MAKDPPSLKICESCGREIVYRKRWAKNWDRVKYCSDECRRNKSKYDYSEKILGLLKLRSPSSSICPSEVLEKDQKQDKILMEHVRRSARRLAHEGKIEITQGGRPVDPAHFRGPIRLRLKPPRG